MSNIKVKPSSSNAPFGKTNGPGQVISRHSRQDGIDRLAAEKARVEKAKARVESRRKAGNSLAHINRLRYGLGIDEQ